MARMSHDKQDARRRAQVFINLELDRYSRRLKQAAEDHISVAYDESTARGLPFDHVAVADEAVAKAMEMYVAKALEAGNAPAIA